MAQKSLLDYTKKKKRKKKTSTKAATKVVRKKRTKKKKARKKGVEALLKGAKVYEIKRKGRTYKVYVLPRMRQIGRSNELRDLKRKALPPGRRISRSGRVYYEYRKNRSDLPGLKI